MSNKYQVLEILKGNNLTIKQIHERLKFTTDKKKNMAMIRTYLHRLKEEGLVREVTRDKQWVIYTAIEKGPQNKDLLNKLKSGFLQYNSLFQNLIQSEISKENLRKLAKENLDISLIKELMEMIQ